MNKKNYLPPSIEVVELQGNVVMAAASPAQSVNTVNDSDDGPSITIGDGMSSGSASSARSSRFTGVWDDE